MTAATSNSQTVTITMTGANDAPVITAAAQPTRWLRPPRRRRRTLANAGKLGGTGTLNFTDVDVSDTGHTAR